MIEDYISEDDQIKIIKEKINGHQLSTFTAEDILLETFITYGIVIPESLVETVIEGFVMNGKLFTTKDGDYAASEAVAEIPSPTI